MKVVASLPSAFLSSPHAVASISAAFFVLTEVVQHLSASHTPGLFSQALETALELMCRAPESLLSDCDLATFQCAMCKAMLQAYAAAADEAQAVQLHLIRALLHPFAIASQQAALLFRVLHSASSAPHQAALVKLLCGVATQASSVRLCRLACELDGSIAYSHFVVEPLAAAGPTARLGDQQWLLAASAVAACHTQPPSAVRSRHLSTTVVPLCSQLLSKMLNSSDLSNVRCESPFFFLFPF